MAENNQAYVFKFVWLNDGDVAHNQSRGLSLQVNGFVPISLGTKNAGYFTSMLDEREEGTKISKICSWDPFKAISDGDDLTLLLKDVKYNVKTDSASNGQVAYTTDANYTSYVEDFSKHMFTDLTAVAADELTVKTDEGSLHKSMSLEFDMSSTMFGDKLKTSTGVFIDAILFFGQAYNKLGRDETAQASLQNCVPIALLVYEGERNERPLLITDIPEKTIIRERLSIGLEQSNVPGDSMIVKTPEYQEWNDVSTEFHVVNDAATVGKRFFLNGNQVETENIQIRSYNNEDLLPEGTMMTKMRMNINSLPVDDWNQDFGSPAQLTVVCDTDGNKNPQTLIAKSKYVYDNDGIPTSGVWDGVAQSYWQASGDESDVKTSGTTADIYSIDYISRLRPGVDFFSEDTPSIYNDSYYTAGHTYRFNGANFFTTESFSTKGGANINTNKVSNIGTNVIINTSDAAVISPNNNPDDEQGGGFVVNSHNVRINEDANYLKPSNTIINSTNIAIFADDDIAEIEDEGRSRTAIIGSNSIVMNDIDNLNAIGVKGKFISSNWKYSSIDNTKNTVVVGGYNSIRNAEDCLTLGVDETTIKGASTKNSVYHSISIGIDNTLVSNDVCRQENVILVGKGLKNDILQGIYDKNRTHTLILGENNNRYAQLKFPEGAANTNYYDYYNKSIVPASVKQIVVGGYIPEGHGYRNPDWVEKYNCAELAIANGDTFETMWTLADVKGRSVDYTTLGVNIAIMPERKQENFDNYNYRSIGSINWSKLYAMLSCMYYDANGFVRYDANRVVNNSEYTHYQHNIAGNTTLAALVECGRDAFPLPN